MVLEKPSDKITIEKFRQHWDHQNASQTITDNYDLIQYATAAACNVIDAVQSEQDLALEGVSLKLLIISFHWSLIDFLRYLYYSYSLTN